MKGSSATVVSIAIAALAASCSGDDDDDGSGGAAGHDLGAGMPSAGRGIHHAGAGGNSGTSGVSGGSAGEGASNQGGSGEADDNEGGNNGVAVGAGGSGEGGGTNSEGGASTAGADGLGGGAGGSANDTDATGGCAGATPAITAVAWLQPDSCDRSVPYEVRDVRDQNGNPVADYTCEWTFSGGRVANTCAGRIDFGDADTGYGVVVVRNTATGATTSATSETVRTIEPQAVEILVTSDACMQFTYDIDRQYGCGGTHVFDIQPAENILTPPPWSGSSQTLQVSTPGVYTLKYTVEGCAPSYARTCIVSDTAEVAVEECP